MISPSACAGLVATGPGGRLQQCGSPAAAGTPYCVAHASPALIGGPWAEDDGQWVRRAAGEPLGCVGLQSDGTWGALAWEGKGPPRWDRAPWAGATFATLDEARVWVDMITGRSFVLTT